MARHSASTPALITDARRGASVDLHNRTRNYLIAMGIRTACFLLLVLVNSPWRWLFLVGAIVLPMVAVLMVNQADKRGQTATFGSFEQDRPALDSFSEHQLVEGEADDDPGSPSDPGPRPR